MDRSAAGMCVCVCPRHDCLDQVPPSTRHQSVTSRSAAAARPDQATCTGAAIARHKTTDNRLQTAEDYGTIRAQERRENWRVNASTSAVLLVVVNSCAQQMTRNGAK